MRCKMKDKIQGMTDGKGRGRARIARVASWRKGTRSGLGRGQFRSRESGGRAPLGERQSGRAGAAVGQASAGSLPCPFFPE